MTRTIGSVALDDGVNSYLSELVVPSTRDVQLEQIVNRQGRMTRIKEDRKPLVIDARGLWADGNGAYWRDWRAALLNQSRASFTLGDGTRFEWVDVTEIAGQQVAAVQAWSATPSVLYAWTMKVASYEPYVREVAPVLQSLGAVSSGPSGPTTTFNVSYSGTAFAEPTWQLTVSIQSGSSLTGVILNNLTTGETITIPNLGSVTTPGLGLLQYMLIDASGGGIGPNNPYATLPTPGNSQYGLVAIPSAGYGVTVGSTGGTADTDFQGQIPTLVPNPTPSIPPVAYTNQISIQVYSTTTLTSASMQVLAPRRFYR